MCRSMRQYGGEEVQSCEKRARRVVMMLEGVETHDYDVRAEGVGIWGLGKRRLLREIAFPGHPCSPTHSIYMANYIAQRSRGRHV